LLKATRVSVCVFNYMWLGKGPICFWNYKFSLKVFVEKCLRDGKNEVSTPFPPL